jgi:hypothetical protein
MPPAPAFYARPCSVEDIVDHTVRRALARVGVPGAAPAEWDGKVESRRERDDADDTTNGHLIHLRDGR